MISLAKEIIYGTAAGVERLLQAGADVDAIDEYGYTPLIETIIVNDLQKAKLLLSYSADVNKPDLTGHTALHWAINNSNKELCQLLLDQGANPNAYTDGAQPVLVFPLLRNQLELKRLLYQNKADLNFAKDFINAKLIGHRFELLGVVDIVNPQGNFIELDFEGFFLEFTLSIIQNSLERSIKNFAMRHLNTYFKKIKKIIKALHISSELIKYQKYTIDIKDYELRINNLLENDPLIIPIVHRGHAITFIKFGNMLAKCDRGENSKREGSVVIYRITKLGSLTKDLLKSLVYIKQTKYFMSKAVNKMLGLEAFIEIPLAAQVTGNCTWANVEATIPTLLFFLLANDDTSKNSTHAIENTINSSLFFYNAWLDWDRDRALDECIQTMEGASKARRFSKATILAAVLFQTCIYPEIRNLNRAEKILKVLTLPEYSGILKSYLKTYYKKKKHKAGINLQNLLDDYGADINLD